MAKVRLTFCALLVAAVALSQEYRGRLQGIVTDTTRGIVLGARVTLENVATGVTVSRDSDANGRYLFDLVEPGIYTVTVDASGFNRFVQKNVLVQNRSDITVDAQLQVGSLTETVTITGAPVSVQFNTSSMEMTLDRSMVENLPLVERNPWTLSMLHPAVLNNFWTKPKNSYRMWSSSTIEIGGSHTNRNNDLLIDGIPAQYGAKGSYSPPVDAVTEVTVQQNSVDAEFGHFAGGLLNVSTKGGTNELHGRAYYFGRNPALNASANPMSGTPNENENHSYGGSAGFPIIRNKLFNHSSIEMWDQRFPKHTRMTMPTDLERTGDFSRSLNARGGLRTIFDPWTTKLNAAANTATREAFPGNVIPKSRLDSTAVEWMKDVWGPNNPGVGPTGVGNFDTEVIEAADYKNFTSRTDWVVNDKLKVFGRFSIFRTTMADEPYTPNNSRAATLYGAPMNALNIAGDAVYTLDSLTVVNIRGAYGSFQDDFIHERQLVTKADLERFWPGNPFYAPYLDKQDERVPLIYPFFQVGSSQFSRPNMWLQRPRHRSIAGKVSRQHGSHYFKFGGEWRNLSKEGWQGGGQIWQFRFNASETASTFIRPDTTANGHEWATFLLGAPANNSLLRFTPIHNPSVQYWSSFIQDDWKLSRNITLNLGLRWEYEQGAREAAMMLSRGFGLDDPIPEFQQNPPQMPKEALAIMNQPYRWNGAWNFTDSANPAMYDPPKAILLPRVGLAIRINDLTSLRVGYGRTVSQSSNQVDIIEMIDIPGFSASTNVFPMLEGVPQSVLRDPFRNNPLVLPEGRKYGRYTSLGGAANWTPNNLKPNCNDRLNLMVQRALPLKFVAEATFFMNFAGNVAYTQEFYMADPQLSYRYKAELAKRVNNPFYNILTPDTFPGSLRNQPQVTLGSLLKPMPHYTGLTQENTGGRRTRYNSIQLRLQRPFANGFNFLLGYNYNQERREEFFNSDLEYLRQWIWARSPTARHKLNLVGVWNVPFGKGRQFGAGANRVLEGIAGGWTMTGTYTFISGTPLRYGQMEVIGNPAIENPDKWGYIFNPKAFKIAEAYTPRSNPLWFDAILGPGQKQLDATLAKLFPITERFQLEFRMEAENLSNTFTAADPDMNVNSATFGRVTAPRQGRFGRVFQYNFVLRF